MDLSKLKKRPSYPFETIAVAVSFSARCEHILAEAQRMASMLGSALLLLHIGDKAPDKELQLDQMMAKAGIDPNKTRVIWMEEGEPVDTILRLCKLNIVDLLILGALQKENLLKFYIGSIARNLSRKAKCSVLLLTDPNAEPQKFKKIVVSGVDNAKTVHTINTSLYLAKNFHTNAVTIVNEVEVPGLAMAIDDSTAPESREIKKNITEESEEHLQTVLNRCNTGDLQVTQKTIRGKAGYAISKYARDKKADLLVINSPDTQLNLLDRIFTHDIEYILADLPTNVLIVHSRV